MRYLILLSMLILSGCSSTSTVNSNTDVASVMNLIALTEENAPRGVKGTFQFPIKAAGSQNSVIFLNTETNYRDRRNISVAIHPKLIDALTIKYRVSPEIFFINKTVEVTGEAKRVKIHLAVDGRKTTKYYFQTHVRVTSLNQIKVLP
jgi:hypothetical protein